MEQVHNYQLLTGMILITILLIELIPFKEVYEKARALISTLLTKFV